MGILGATVMPHSLFLGSALATQDRISFRAPPEAETISRVDDEEIDEPLKSKLSEKVSCLWRSLDKFKDHILGAFRRPPANLYSTAATRYSERQNNSFEFIRAHLCHGMVDVVGCLLGFAIIINSLYVIRLFSDSVV